MPLNLDSCIAGIFIPGNIGASSGQTPIVRVMPPRVPATFAVHINEVITATATVSVFGDVGATIVETAAAVDAVYFAQVHEVLVGEVAPATDAPSVLEPGVHAVDVAEAASAADAVDWVGAPLDAVASVTGAWSLSRDMKTSFAGGTRYTKIGTAITRLEDQSGNNRDFTDGGLAARRPVETTAFPASVLCADFAGVSTNTMLNVALSNFITASSGAVVVSVIVDAITSNSSTSYSNDGIIADQSVYMGLFARNLSGVTFYAYNFDGTEDAPSTTGSVGTACVLMWRHHGGNQYISINGGAEVTVASGNTQVMTGLLVLGGNNTGSACNCKIAELFTTSDGSQTAALATAIANMKTHIGA